MTELLYIGGGATLLLSFATVVWLTEPGNWHDKAFVDTMPTLWPPEDYERLCFENNLGTDEHAELHRRITGQELGPVAGDPPGWPD